MSEEKVRDGLEAQRAPIRDAGKSIGCAEGEEVTTMQSVIAKTVIAKFRQELEQTRKERDNNKRMWHGQINRTLLAESQVSELQGENKILREKFDSLKYLLVNFQDALKYHNLTSESAKPT